MPAEGLSQVHSHWERFKDKTSRCGRKKEREIKVRENVIGRGDEDLDPSIRGVTVKPACEYKGCRMHPKHTLKERNQ